MTNEIEPGTYVMYRTRAGVWRGPTRALSAPRLDVEQAIGRNHYLTVLINVEGWDHPVNWPVDHVRVVSPGPHHPYPPGS